MPNLQFESAPVLADSEMARTFIHDWHGLSDDLINLVRLAAYSKTPLQPLGISTKDLYDLLETTPLHDLIYSTEPSNVYHSVAFMKDKPVGFKRGGKQNVAYSNGAILDADVKTGAFESEQHIINTYQNLEVPPTIVVRSGSGGLHLYWKTNQKLNVTQTELLNSQIHAHMSVVSGTKIDKLVNADRILRLPGSVRFEKYPGEKPTPVTLLTSSSETIELEDIEKMCLDSWTNVQERRKQTHERIKYQTTQAISELTGWPRLLAIASLQDSLNDIISWDQILSPTRLTIHEEKDYEGRKVWTRPHGEGKSASTDWPQSPHVMSCSRHLKKLDCLN